MRKDTGVGLPGRVRGMYRAVAALRVPLYAANAGYFLILSVFPGLLLLLGLLRYTPLEVEYLGESLAGLFPEALREGVEALVLTTYDSISGAALGVSAVAALWSAGRGMYGILTGLNRVYGVTENRGYITTRLISTVYTFVFLLVLLMTLTLHVFGAGLLALLSRAAYPLLGALPEILDLRFFLLLILQTAVFALMYRVLPNRRSRFRDGLPGALVASSGWQIFSDLYSVYVERFAGLRNVYGSVYAVALSMLWLYCCMAIVFYGGAMNRWLEEL